MLIRKSSYLHSVPFFLSSPPQSDTSTATTPDPLAALLYITRRRIQQIIEETWES